MSRHSPNVEDPICQLAGAQPLRQLTCEGSFNCRPPFEPCESLSCKCMIGSSLQTPPPPPPPGLDLNQLLKVAGFRLSLLGSICSSHLRI